MGICFGCFGGGDKHMSKEEERLASEEARAKAAEAAQKRFISKFPFSSLNSCKKYKRHKIYVFGFFISIPKWLFRSL